MAWSKTILITGGAGFIGSHAVRHFVTKYPEYRIVNLDKLTYAGNPANNKDVEDRNNYVFVHGDIVDRDFVKAIFNEYRFDSVIHLAAESHVDRSISGPDEFVYTNVIGTLNLLNAARQTWLSNEGKLFYHISTDEVFGALGDTGAFNESTPYDPRSPYSASKAGSDHLARAYFHTYGLPVIISNCSNNYGPNQYPEKLIPLAIQNIIAKKPVPVYGKGEQVRDWLWVGDHIGAMDLIFHQGRKGETYTIGGSNEWRNIDLVRLLCEVMDEKLKRMPGDSEKLISFVTDRPGHDQRYAIDSTKLKNELGWNSTVDMRNGLNRTVDWYLENQDWVRAILAKE